MKKISFCYALSIKALVYVESRLPLQVYTHLGGRLLFLRPSEAKFLEHKIVITDGSKMHDNRGSGWGIMISDPFL